MSGLALGLVLTSAFLHATWNLAAKKVGGGLAFVFLLNLCSNFIYAPVALAVFFTQDAHIPREGIVFIVGNAIVHIFYFLLLSYGYRIGDLSLVYPLARGTGPMFSTLVAVILLGERPTLLAIIGITAIGIGVVIFSGGLRIFRSKDSHGAVTFALLTGLIISAYTIWDKIAVGVLDIHPLLYDWSGGMVRSGLLIMVINFSSISWADVKKEWRLHYQEALIVGILSPLAYILVLAALTFSPVSYIAPAREISILIGAVMGARLLAEGEVPRRLFAASVMVCGLIALALG